MHKLLVLLKLQTTLTVKKPDPTLFYFWKKKAPLLSLICASVYHVRSNPGWNVSGLGVLRPWGAEQQVKLNSLRTCPASQLLQEFYCKVPDALSGKKLFFSFFFGSGIRDQKLFFHQIKKVTFKCFNQASTFCIHLRCSHPDGPLTSLTSKVWAQ